MARFRWVVIPLWLLVIAGAVMLAGRLARGARRPALALEPAGRRHPPAGGAAVRVVIAEDLALLRDGLVRLLRDSGMEVVAAVEDGDGLLRAIEAERPDVAVVDVRLPPSFRDEGLRAALEARRRAPGTAVLIVSQAGGRRRHRHGPGGGPAGRPAQPRLAARRAHPARARRARLVAAGPQGLLDVPRPGAPRSVSDERLERVIVMTLERRPPDAQPLVDPRNGARQRALPVHDRARRAFALQPQRARSSKLSADRPFVDKLRDIVGPYPDPPERALVVAPHPRGEFPHGRGSEVDATRRPGRPPFPRRWRAGRGAGGVGPAAAESRPRSG
jgi:CheY-like chemotaxis protein